ncbi:MAG: hypothetical protein WED04_12125 [Promethearchaeati archaeon SRVP18_Atabeyarchaeia-1]
MWADIRTSNLLAKVGSALITYNKYRSPEVTAELVALEKDGRRFSLCFAGSFCRTCGFCDYFEDFVYDLLDESGVEARIVEVEEQWMVEEFKVTYEVLRVRDSTEQGSELRRSVHMK